MNDLQKSTLDACDAAPPARLGRRALWGRRGFWFVLAVAGCVAVGVGHQYYRHRQAQSAFRESLEALDRTDPGWRLHDIEAAREAVPDRANAALCVALAGKFLKTPGESDLDSPYSPLHGLPPNQRPWADELVWVTEQLQAEQHGLDKARDLADLPRGRHSVAYQRNTFQTTLPHLAIVLHLANLLWDDALVRAEDGDVKGALRSCRAALNAGRSIGDEPFAYSQMVRISCVNRTCRRIEHVLGQGEAAEDDLRDLQALLEDEERFPRLLVMTRGERALLHDLVDAVESGDVPVDELVSASKASRRPTRNTVFYSSSAARAEHAPWLQRLTEAVAVARLPSDQRPAAVEAYSAAIQEGLSGNLLYTIAPNLRWMDDITRRSETRLRCLAVALAVERYRLRHGRWPAALTDLAPDLLAAVPADPADGEPLGYRRYDDRVVVYSRFVPPVGTFGVNPGPPRAFNPDEPPVAGVGLAVHLFDLKHRRQPAGPKPALLAGPPTGRIAVQ